MMKRYKIVTAEGFFVWFKVTDRIETVAKALAKVDFETSGARWTDKARPEEFDFYETYFALAHRAIESLRLKMDLEKLSETDQKL